MANSSKHKSIFNRKRPPRVVTILGHKIKVRIIPYLEDNGEELYGAWNYDEKTIYLQKGCDWRSVLLHELIHTVFSLSGCGEGLPMAREENIAVALEHALLPLIKSE
ncbi:MAG: hypothetical protein ACO3QQ_03025 [Candidatus Nanopelagicaceae bacterium]